MIPAPSAGTPVDCADADPCLGPADFRGHFPMLARTVHLASCSLGARSSDLDAALAAMLEAMAAGGAPWELFEEQGRLVREGFAALVGARPDEVALIPNASVGAYQVASTLDWSSRPKVVTPVAEFPSVAHVWLAQRPRGAQVVHVGGPGGRVDAADYAAAIDERTGLVSVPLAAYAGGDRLPVEEVAALARAAGARVFVDAYQSLGVEPVDVDGLGCDYLVGGTMKYLLGLPGLGLLYVRRGAEGDREPRLTGWFGRVDPFAFDPRHLDFADGARRFETGTPAVPALYAANAGLDLIRALDLATVREHVTGLGDYAAARLTDAGERVRLPAERARRGAQVGLVDDDPAALGRWLATRRIAVSPRRDVARLSLHYYSTVDDVDAACAAIEEYRARTGRRGRPGTE